MSFTAKDEDRSLAHEDEGTLRSLMKVLRMKQEDETPETISETRILSHECAS